MASIGQAHFGGNIVLTNDTNQTDSAFSSAVKEISFFNFRYPGGGVTEDQTWQNGGLEKIFGSSMEEGSAGYVMTLREALKICDDIDATISIVVPTFQFYETKSDLFDGIGFGRYLDEIEKAILDFPDVQVSGFEIGNEYWAKISAEDYGRIANKQIPEISELLERLKDQLGEEWGTPSIGIQAGAAWRSSGTQESKQIADKISLDNRELIDVIYQHAYPNPNKEFDSQLNGVMEPVYAFNDIEGFRDDLKISLSEFNMGIHEGEAANYGVNQGALWIEEFGRHVDAGVDSIDHWGIAYKWLTTKFYDTKFPPAEALLQNSDL